MQNSYIRFGRRFAIPSTAQILDELKADFVPGYVPVSRGYRRPSATVTESAQMNRIEQPDELDRRENDGGAAAAEPAKKDAISAVRNADSHFAVWEKRTSLVKRQAAAESAASDAKTSRLRTLRLAREADEEDAPSAVPQAGHS